jgi:cellulose synthase/poly-beta-1,6-N-acetylglucosamine synthase-like glycosyltransferase
MTKENGRSISDLLTIVIPSKNEGIGLWECIYHISKQEGIENTRVIIADSSDDPHSKDVLSRLQTGFKPTLKIETVAGGMPARARYNGAMLVRTDLILFLDADMILTNQNVIKETVERMGRGDLDLLTTTVETEEGYNHLYKAFYWFQILLRDLLKNPFAIGGFQLWSTDAYERVGGWIPDHLFAEDFHISRRVKPKRMEITKIAGVWTSARRFKARGKLWMMRLMLKTYLKRNDPEFYRTNHGWWG